MNLNLLESAEAGFRGLEEIGAKMINGERSFGKFNAPNGSVRNVFFNTVSKSGGWSYGLIIPEHQLLETSNHIKKILIVLVSVIVIITIVVAFILASSIARPIAVVKDAIVGVSAGDLVLSHIPEKERLKINKRHDEIGDMGRSYIRYA